MPDSRYSGGHDLNTTVMETIRPSRTTGKREAMEFRNEEPSVDKFTNDQLGEENEMGSPEKDSEMSSSMCSLGVGKAGLPMSLPS